MRKLPYLVCHNREAIKDQYGVIDRIAQELQGAVMAIRMMPVGQVFQRFPRLVRDLARKLGKQDPSGRRRVGLHRLRNRQSHRSHQNP